MRFLKGCIIMLVIFATQLAVSARSTADDKATRQVPIRYASPAAVFDAYRAAQAKRDYRTEFFCLTPESRRILVYYVYMGCHFDFDAKGGLSPRVTAVLKKHGVEDFSRIHDEYSTRYQEKHGVDIRELERQYRERRNEYVQKEKKKNPSLAESGEPLILPDSLFVGVELPERDEQLFQQVVAGRIKDKPGFYDDVARAVQSDFLPRTGPLQNIRIQGDKATGRVTETGEVVSYEALRGQQVKRVVSTVKTNKTFRFRRIEGGWLIELLPE